MVVTLNDLPLVAKMLIFDELAYNTKKTCRLVCKDWRDTLDNNKRCLKNKFTNAHLDNSSMLLVFSTDKIFTKLQVGTLTNSFLLETLLLPISLDYYNHVELLTFNTSNVRKEESSEEVVPSFVSKVVNTISGDCMKMILHKFQNIRILKFCSSCFVNVKNPEFLGQLSLNNVEELLVETVGIYNENQHKAIMTLAMTFNFGYKLKKFTWELTLAKYDGEVYFLLYERIYFFIGTHQGLKEVTVNHPSGTILNGEYSPGRLALYNRIYALLKTLQLTKLQVRTQRKHLPILNAISIWRFEYVLTVSQKKLHTLGLYGSHIIPDYKFRRYLLQVRPTLEQFHVNLRTASNRTLSFNWKTKSTENQLKFVLKLFYPPSENNNI